MPQYAGARPRLREVAGSHSPLMPVRGSIRLVRTTREAYLIDMASLISRMVRPVVARSTARNDRLSLEELRQKMERLARFSRPPSTVRVEQRSIDGIPSEWIEPRSGGNGAAILYLHGGAFCSGSPLTHRHLAGRISQLSGASVLVPDYHLAPEHPFPAALDDAAACYAYLLAGGYSPRRIIIAGDSAGGNLALSLLVRLRDGGGELPAAGVCLSPVVDLARTDEGTRLADAERAPYDPMIRLSFVAPMVDRYVDGRDPRDPLLSPLFGDLGGLPPILLQAGGDELLLTDARAFAARAREAGVDVALEVYPGMWHVWQIFIPYLPEARRAVASIVRFVDTRLQARKPMTGIGRR